MQRPRTSPVVMPQRNDNSRNDNSRMTTMRTSHSNGRMKTPVEVPPHPRRRRKPLQQRGIPMPLDDSLLSHAEDDSSELGDELSHIDDSRIGNLPLVVCYTGSGDVMLVEASSYQNSKLKREVGRHDQLRARTWIRQILVRLMPRLPDAPIPDVKLSDAPSLSGC